VKVAAFVLVAVATACGSKPTEGSPPTAPGVKTHDIDIDIDAFQDTTGRPLRFELEPGIKFAPTNARVERSGATFSWFNSADHELAVVTSKGRRAYGTAFKNGRAYRLTSLANGKLRSVPIDLSRFKRTHPLAAVRRKGQQPPVQTEDGPIEIIVAYTDSAAEDCEPIDLAIENAVKLTNIISEESGLNTRFHLAHMYRTTYKDYHYSMTAALDYLTRKDDTQINEIHGYRTQYRADVAVLVLSINSADEGVAQQTMADSDTAFAVVDCEAATATFTMAHELGHLLGLNDDNDDEESVPFPEGYGYFLEEKKWRTVMTYPESCQSCELIPRWSNPKLNYPVTTTDPAGTSNRSNSVGVIGKTAGYVSRFQPPL
jgi:peptidyl-Asp metalloendopeptidase